jgi:hypothetical protein
MYVCNLLFCLTPLLLTSCSLILLLRSLGAKGIQLSLPVISLLLHLPQSLDLSLLFVL